MNKFSQYQDHKLVFQYDVEILTEIIDPHCAIRVED